MTSSVAPGYTTTEFWQMLLAQTISAVAGFLVLFHTHFDPSGLQALVPAMALLAAAVASSFYSHARAKVKAAALALRS